MANSLAPGLLIAAPPLGDPNFERSVVLLASHDRDGAFGWVLNGAVLMNMSQLLVRSGVLKQEPSRPLPGTVRRGGPVHEGQVWLVYPEAERPLDLPGQFCVSPGIYASASRDFLESLAQGTELPSVLALAGYAGWGPGQLEREIGEGSWLPVPVDPRLVFSTASADLWNKAYESVGIAPMQFASRTVGSA
jgi:putative transcriptional regulator